MKKGMITKLEKNYAIIATKDMKVEKIRLKSNMKEGTKVFYFKKDIYKEDFIMKKSWMGIAAAFLIVAMIFGFSVLTNNVDASTYAIITVDINPSIQIKIDENNIVLKVKALNDDAEEVINDEMVGKELQVVLDEITANLIAGGFLLEDDTIMITSTILDNDDEDEDKVVKAEALEKDLEEFMAKKEEQYNFLIFKGTEDAEKAAKSQGLSLGKYTMLKFFDETVTKEDIKGMKMSEIMERKEVRELARFEVKSGKVNGKGNGITELFIDEDPENPEESADPEESEEDGNGNGKGKGKDNNNGVGNGNGK